MKQMIIKDEIKYLLFSEIYHKVHTPKAGRKAFAILEATIQCLANKSFSEVTLEMVAREAGVTRPLIKNYFDDLDDLKMSALKYIRLLFQKLTVNAMEKEAREDKMLGQYVDACSLWTANFKTHASVWMGFLHQCSRAKTSRSLNTAAVVTGEERIRALLRAGKQKGFFSFTDEAATAKLIQTVITGAVFTFMSEDVPDRQRYADIVRQQCLSIAGAK